MISKKTLLSEIRAILKEQGKCIMQSKWDEVARLQHVLEILEFVRDWKDD